MKEHRKAGIRKEKLPTELTSDNSPKCKLCGAVIVTIFDNKVGLYKHTCQNCGYTRYESSTAIIAPHFSKASEI